MSKILARLSEWAGLWVATLLWATNMQLSQILPLTDCVTQRHVSAVVSLLAMLGTAVAGFLSWRSSRADITGFRSPRTIHFAGALSALSSLIFLFALVLQMAAAMVLTGCER
jgi:hypothetical protein